MVYVSLLKDVGIFNLFDISYGLLRGIYLILQLQHLIVVVVIIIIIIIIIINTLNNNVGEG
jgi:hypothetical protein